jgi:hypothetical protein
MGRLQHRRAGAAGHRLLRLGRSDRGGGAGDGQGRSQEQARDRAPADAHGTIIAPPRREVQAVPQTRLQRRDQPLAADVLDDDRRLADDAVAVAQHRDGGGRPQRGQLGAVEVAWIRNQEANGPDAT